MRFKSMGEEWERKIINSFRKILGNRVDKIRIVYDDKFKLSGMAKIGICCKCGKKILNFKDMIIINDNLSSNDKKLVLIHELLHFEGYNHDYLGRKLGYSSGNDTFSLEIAKEIFGRKINWS